MADVRIKDLPTNGSPSASQYVPTDLATTEKLTIQALVDTGAPLASQAEAEAGVQATKRMTPLTTKQAIAVQAATFAQGALADTAVQPGDLSAVATTGNYNDLSNQPSLSADLIYPVKADAVAATIPSIEHALRINGSVTVGDGLGGLYIDTNNGSADTFVSSGGTSRTWYRAGDVSSTRLVGAPDIRNFLDTASYVATRTAAKALDTTKETTLILTEAGREGIFNWKAGDYSAQITADTLEGIYIKANAIASSAGAWVRVFSGLPDVRWFGAVSGGNATSAIQQGMNLSGVLSVPPGLSFTINAQITVPAGGGLVCPDHVNRPTFLIDMTVFTNATRAGELGSTGCVFLSSGGIVGPFTTKSKLVFQNIRIIPNGYTGSIGTIPTARRTTIIAARNVSDISITGCEIAGFCVGTAIMVDSGVRPINISKNYIHDWYSNDTWPDVLVTQTTAILLDDGRINGVGTLDFQITDNTIRNLEKGSTTYTTWGVQTDAINLNGGNGGYGTVSRNIIYNVDEGVDCFMQGVTISDNNIRLTQGSALKFIHGAKKCDVTGNICLDSRGWGISAVSTVNGSVEDNHFTGNYVEATGGTLNTALTTTACLYIGESVNVCRRNFFSGNTWVANGCMYLCKNNDYLGSGSENFSTGDEWRGPGTSGWFNATNLLLICQKPVNGTDVKATFVSNLTKSTSGSTNVVFDSEIRDRRGEYNPATGEFTAQLPGPYDVVTRMTTASLTAATLRMILNLNAAAVDVAQGITQTSGSVAAEVQLHEMQIMLGSGQKMYNAIQFENAPGVGIIFGANALQNAFLVKMS